MVATSIIIAPSEAEAKDAQDRAREIAWDAMLRRGLPDHLQAVQPVAAPLHAAGAPGRAPPTNSAAD